MVPTFSEKEVKSVLTRTRGYLNGYSHSLNPYKGCVYGCSYCYVRRLPVSLFHEGEWGTWVEAKTNAKEVLSKEIKREKKKGPVTIFMSSSTDPYQPLEHKLGITHKLLEVLTEPDCKPDFLFVQTRSPLVIRDIALFKALKDRVMISITIETDQDEVRKRFAPASPPIPARLKALKTLSDEGIPNQAAVAPLLPSTTDFPAVLQEVTKRICLDDFFQGDGAGGKRTNALNIPALFKAEERETWYSPSALSRLQADFEERFGQDHVFISQEGFAPY
ncbi:radical SAM protein [Pullulanibacillus sp. KACC 23026]|uniref:SPL family radical SAM protein n=1 Tax=Pullulanibacillus sp. KACC 23026 TaxID=3028315 RepID=UPI0023B10755|nr:radical SAM protein [Pullulanibacillus sp. KACC 23026]WEG10887.1 radical SAM protein [Pullulanibacillus sp. KACC 23026]